MSWRGQEYGHAQASGNTPNPASRGQFKSGQLLRCSGQVVWVRIFKNAEEVRLAAAEWIKLYNEHWLIQRHQRRAPALYRASLLASKVRA